MTTAESFDRRQKPDVSGCYRVFLSVCEGRFLFGCEIRIDAPPVDVWAILSDLSLVHEYSPGVKWAYYTTEQKAAWEPDDTATLPHSGQWKNSLWIGKEEKSMTIEITEGKGLPPIRDIVCRFTLTRTGTGTMLHTNFTYVPKYGFLGELISSVLVKRQFKSAFKGLLVGLKRYVEDRPIHTQPVKPGVARPEPVAA